MTDAVYKMGKDGLEFAGFEAIRPRIEIWTSNQNQEERHYFMPEQPNTYIFGYNPQLISGETAERIVNMILGKLTKPPYQANG